MAAPSIRSWSEGVPMLRPHLLFAIGVVIYLAIFIIASF